MYTAPDTPSRGALQWMIENPVAANLLMLALLVGGAIVLLNITQEIFPDTPFEEVRVTVSYPGASPEEVEQGITLVIEQAVEGLDGIDEVASVSSEGFADIEIEALSGTNMQRLTQDVQSAVDRITTFPEEAEDPVVYEVLRQRSVLRIILFGEAKPTILRTLAEQTRNFLLDDEEISLVELQETNTLQISIEIPQKNLRAYNLTLEDVASRLRADSVDLPGGGIKADSGEILLRVKEKRHTGADFARTPIVTTANGTEVLLEDIATITDGFADADLINTYNGQPSVAMWVYRVADQTPLSVSDAARKRLKSIEEQLPEGVSVVLLNDYSIIYKQRMELLLKNGLMGLVLVLLLLTAFLELRLAFWVAMGIPISFLGSFLLIQAFDASINMITMFAFLISLGIVVDDAIVVGENVFTMRQRGMPPVEAAISGIYGIYLPVIFSILTNIVAFTPLLFIPGVAGQIFGFIPVVVISVFFLSLVESLFILPAHLAHVQDTPPGPVRQWIQHRQERINDWLSSFIENRYLPFLKLAIHWRYLTVVTGVGILFVSLIYVKTGRLGFTFMPKVESDYAYVAATLPSGSSTAKGEAIRDRLTEAAVRVKEAHGGDELVIGMLAHVYRNKVIMRVFLTPSGTRPIPTDEFIKKWRQEAGEIPGLESLFFESDRGGPSSGKSLTFDLSHRNTATLEKAAGELSQALSSYAQVKDIDDGFAQGKEQLDFTLTPTGKALGLTARGVAKQVRAAYYGTEVLRQQRGENEIKVLVRRPENERISLYDLHELVIRTPAGNDVLLREVVHVERGRAYTVIERRDGRRVLSVTADATPRSQSSQITQDVADNVISTLQEKYPGLDYSSHGKQADQEDSLEAIGRGLLLAITAIYILLAIPFKSYLQPLIIMACIPFGAIGAFLGHVIMGYSLSIISMLGIVALGGVIVNDSLIFVDYANQQRQRGLDTYFALQEAGRRRFRPILLTTVTTFVGLAPMILETSRQARFLIPMALSLGFGIVFATLINLILVPALYTILEDLRNANFLPFSSKEE